MKKFLILIVAIFAGFVAFAVLAALVAATFAAMANSGVSLSSTATVPLGIFSEIVKWGLSIFAGIRTHKILQRKYNGTQGA